MLEQRLTDRRRRADAALEGRPPASLFDSAAAGLHFPVSELFTSIQGEGKLTGVRSHFIRLHGCNLRCRWCDTPYASWEAKEPRAQARGERPPARNQSPPTPAPEAATSPAASLPILHDGARIPLRALVETARASGADHIVITGGEPLIFPHITDLSSALMAAGFHVTIETAGTVLPRATERREQRAENREQRAHPTSQKPAISDSRSQVSDSAVHHPAPEPGRLSGAAPLSSPRSNLCSLLSLSPKLASSTPLPGDPRDPTGAWRRRHEQRRLNFPVMQAMLDRASGGVGGDRQIKFVITSPADLPEIESILARLTGWQPHDIFLMPEGVTPPPPETVRWITEAAARRGWRYGPRLHIELFGNTRGT